MHRSAPLSRLAGIIGNVLGHYDNALFGLLAPFISPLFFTTQDPITALILTYAILPVGILTRPLGSLFFGWLGDRFGRRNALLYSLIGMACATVGMGFLPSYREIGSFAPALLALGRMLQNFCAAGESAGAAIFVLEHTEEKKRSFMSSLYDASSMIGIIIASSMVALFSHLHMIEEGWRALFWAGGLTAFFGVLLRLKTNEASDFVQAANQKLPISTILSKHKNALFSIIFVSGLSYITFSTCFTLMNGYIPLITSLTKAEVMKLNTLLLVIDMLLLPCFGILSTRIGKERLMFYASLALALTSLPLFSLLQGASLVVVTFVRLLIVLFGVAFAAPYHAWAIERVSPEHRYTIVAFGTAIGSQVIGAPAAAISLWLYHTMHWTAAPGLYLCLIASIACLIIYGVHWGSARGKFATFG